MEVSSKYHRAISPRLQILKELGTKPAEHDDVANGLSIMTIVTMVIINLSR